MRRDDTGSAPVEFALVSVLVLALFLSLLQLAFALHVRNTAQAAAADGARHGATLGRTPADATRRTRELLDRSVPALVDDVSSARERARGVPTVVVEVRMRLPVVGPWGPARGLRVRAHAFDEAAA